LAVDAHANSCPVLVYAAAATASLHEATGKKAGKQAGKQAGEHTG